MKIAIIGGRGRQGFGLALRLASSGIEIVIGSRERATQKARELVERRGFCSAALRLLL